MSRNLQISHKPFRLFKYIKSNNINYVFSLFKYNYQLHSLCSLNLSPVSLQKEGTIYMRKLGLFFCQNVSGYSG